MRKMKKLPSCAAAILLVVAMVFITACSGGGGKESTTDPAKEKTEEVKPAEQTEVIVFAAASMTETLEEIAKLYAAENSAVKLTFNFDSSGTLQTQIEEGAACDLFISAAQKQMDALADQDKIVADSRIDILENKVVLVVPSDNPKVIKSFDQLAEALKAGDILMAMGNSDVPVGQYTQKILAYFGLNEEELAASGVITYGSNVKEVTSQVAEASVDCGVVYSTDAFSANLTVVDTATPEMCGQVIYPAAVLTDSSNQKQAQEFLDFLSTDKAMDIFKKVGFEPVK